MKLRELLQKAEEAGKAYQSSLDSIPHYCAKRKAEMTLAKYLRNNAEVFADLIEWAQQEVNAIAECKHILAKLSEDA